MRLLRGVRFLLASLAAGLATAATAVPVDCTSHTRLPAGFIAPEAGVQIVVFAARDLRQGRCWHTDAVAVNERHPPWSTFKLPHFLIALESGAVTSAAEVLHWDPRRRAAESYWPQAWQQDLNLSSAFTVSAAWPFQELVPRIGAANYGQWLGRFQYGNRDTARGRDDFWLGGPLAISAAEQVAFLSCLAEGGCGASAASVRALEEVARQSGTGARRLYAKTGSGPLKPGEFSGAFEGWYVGYVRSGKGQALIAFATYVRADSYAALRTYRERVSRQVLAGLGFLPR